MQRIEIIGGECSSSFGFLGDTFPGDEPCEECTCWGGTVTCGDSGLWCPVTACTEMTAAECAQSDSCSWVEPGCDRPEGYNERTGCFAGCEADVSCAAGSHCETLWTNPCWGDMMCDACGAEASVCVPDVNEPAECSNRGSSSKTASSSHGGRRTAIPCWTPCTPLVNHSYALSASR